jgi:hypothetical protein
MKLLFISEPIDVKIAIGLYDHGTTVSSTGSSKKSYRRSIALKNLEQLCQERVRINRKENIQIDTSN